MLYPLSPVLWLVKEVQASVIWLQLALLTSLEEKIGIFVTV